MKKEYAKPMLVEYGDVKTLVLSRPGGTNHDDAHECQNSVTNTVNNKGSR
jgi:hypothetical protein